MKIMSAVPTSPMDSFDASPTTVEKPKAVFIRAVLPNQQEDSLVGGNSEREVKQGLNRVIAKISGYRDESKRRKLIENYQKMLASIGPVGQKLDKCA